MFCIDCGRSNGTACHCLSRKPIRRIEGWILLIAFLMIPPLSSINLILNNAYSWRAFLSQVTFLISVYLILISIFTFIFKRSYLALFFGCHQRTERSLKFMGQPLNICARCTGIMSGVLGANLLFIWISNPLVILPFMIPLVVDGIIQKTSDYQSNNFKRLITGALFGPSLPLILTAFHHMIILSIQFFL